MHGEGYSHVYGVASCILRGVASCLGYCKWPGLAHPPLQRAPVVGGMMVIVIVFKVRFRLRVRARLRVKVRAK